MRKSRNKKKIKKRTYKFKKQYGGNNEDETHCIYISSHGIIKASQKINGVYYVKSNELETFNIPSEPFVLVTGNEDTEMITDVKDKANEILKSPNLIHWYSQNLVTHDNEKLTCIPIGLDYHTIAEHKAGYEWWGEKQTPIQQEKFLINLNKPQFKDREIKIYCNFLNSIRGRYGAKDRKEALEQIPNELLIKEEKNIARNETWTHITKYAFVLSPHGNGLDCHRTWEALVLGAIPIIKTSPIDELFEELPVLIVDKWSDINEELLNTTIESFKDRQFNYEKLKLSYWIDSIKEHMIKTKDNKDKKTAIIIEPRKHKALEFVLNNILENLDNTWNVIIFHGNLNKEYIQNIINKKLKQYFNRIKLLPLNKDNLSVPEYSALLASKEFYNNIPTNIFLVFQTDTMINKNNKNSINNFLKYDYVGAPWRSDNKNHIKYNAVGNGGFSLRNKNKMLEIIEKCPYKGEPEDDYFAYPCKEVKINKPSFRLAKKFASETHLDKDSFGLHKPWIYHNDINMLNELFPDIKTLYELQK